MRLDDIRLWEAARSGKPEACVEIAARYFRGGNGLPQNFRLGLSYLQQQLNVRDPEAVFLLGEKVPLEILMSQSCRTLLEEAAHLGSKRACLKLGVWAMLTKSEREIGIKRLNFFEDSDLKLNDYDLDDPREFVRVLGTVSHSDVIDKIGVTLSGAREALRNNNISDACYCIRAAADLGPPSDKIAEAVALTVQLAAHVPGELSLPVELIESSLRIRSEQGDAEAQYCLGRALGDLQYGLLEAKQLVRRANLEHAASLLLRAADAGKSQAWLDLSELEHDRKAGKPSLTKSRFFLEKAAQSGVLLAQKRLGALLLKEATSVQKAEVGVHWLSLASENGDVDSAKLLRTLILPIPELPAEFENSVIAKVKAVNPELGARLALARALHLTRHETMSFNANPNIRSWGLCLRGTTKENPQGRLAPAVTPRMKSELQNASVFFSTSSAVDNAMIHQRGRIQRKLFKEFSLHEHLFFAKEIGRSRSHYGFGRHWAARVDPLLNDVLQ